MHEPRRSKRRLVYSAAAALIVILAVWALVAFASQPGKATVVTVKPAAQTNLSAWLADWQWAEGVEDLKGMVAGLDSLQAFAAYFDESDHLTFTDAFRSGLVPIREAAASNSDMRMDLTVVNDILKEDGNGSQKDSGLVSRLLADKAARSRHVNEIVGAVQQYGFGGVELDYEKINDRDWGRYSLFIFELYNKLKAQGKTLRVVLEPRAPVEKLKLPSGPAYVMMAYNLYGNHSGPGPKADKAFIRKLAARLAYLPGDPYLALAVGGFDWTGGQGTAASVTERQAAELAKSSLKPPMRDATSGSLSFQYLDSEGIKHTVWYADEKTLASWIETARLAGRSNIAIWRLGELGDGSIKLLSGF